MLATVARVIREVDERLPVLRLETWRDHLDAGLDAWIYRAGASVFSAFGGIALLLAVIGVYGVKSYVVSRRTREFGIRIAIGAHPRALLWQVLREGGRITAIGIGIGLLLAVGAGQFLQGILYGVDAVEPVVLVLTPLILLASSLLPRTSRRFAPRESIRRWRCDPNNEPLVNLRRDSQRDERLGLTGCALRRDLHEVLASGDSGETERDLVSGSGDR